MAFTAEAATLTGIANAIRQKDGTTAPIIASTFANRIRMIPITAVGENDRKMFLEPSVLTPAQEDARRLIRCDGSPAYPGRSQEIYDTFKGDWIKYTAAIRTIGFPPANLASRVYDAPRLVGNKLYIGSTTSLATSILVINTWTGRVSEITGLPSRIYNGFQLVGTKLYCFQTTGTIATHNSIVCIDTTNDTVTQPQFSATNRAYNLVRLVGTRLFFGTGTTSATELPYLDTDTNVYGAVTGLPSRTHNQMFVVGTKLYVSSSTASTSIISISGTTATLVQTLPSRNYNTWFLAGTFLYASSTTAATTIVRINTANDQFTEVGATGTPLPSRSYTSFILVGTKLYCGSTSSYDSIVVINHTTGVYLREVTGLTSRAYSVFFLLGAGVGAKLYVIGYSGTVVVIIDTDMDTWSEAATGGTSRSLSQFYLNGTRLYIFSSTAVTNMVTIDTTTDTGILIDLFTQYEAARAQSSWVIAHGVMYIGSTTAPAFGYGNMKLIDVTANARIPDITELPRRGILDISQRDQERQTAVLVFANDKLYILGSSTSINIALLTESILPNHVLPIYIYGP